MNKPQLAQPVLLRPEEAAEALAIGRTQVFQLIASGELESVQIGRLRRVPYEALQRYVDRLSFPSPGVLVDPATVAGR